MDSVSGNGVSIIIPTLNEGENIDAVLDAIVDAIGITFPYEVLVVDDGSTDDTRARVHARTSTVPVKLVARDRPTGGLTGAVVAGAREARHRVVVVMDGDGSHPAAAIPELVAPVLANERDIVVGSRRVPGGSTPDWPWNRRLASRTASAAAWPIADVRDPMSGFFATTRERLGAVDPNAKGFKIGLEVMTADGKPLRTAEVPIVFHDRRYGESKMKASTIVHYGVRLMALGGGETRARMLRRYAIAGCVGLLGRLHRPERAGARLGGLARHAESRSRARRDARDLPAQPLVTHEDEHEGTAPVHARAHRRFC